MNNFEAATIALATSDSATDSQQSRNSEIAKRVGLNSELEESDAEESDSDSGVGRKEKSESVGVSEPSGTIASSEFKQRLVTKLKELSKDKRDEVISILKKLFNHKTNTFSIKEIKYYKNSKYTITDEEDTELSDTSIADAILTYYEYSEVKIKSKIDNFLSIQIKGFIDEKRPIMFEAGEKKYKMELKTIKINVSKFSNSQNGDEKKQKEENDRNQNVKPTPKTSSDAEALALSLVAMDS